jgi:hypothetical protein
MNNSPKLVTKYCTPANRDHMLHGHFRIALLSEYRESEEKIGLMSDKNEGKLQSDVIEPIQAFTGSVEGMNFKDCNMSGARVNISVNRTIEALVFCASNGSYSESTHRNLLCGNGRYPPNPNLTAYLVLNERKVRQALAEAVSSQYNPRCGAFGDAVHYGDRRRIVGAKHMQQSFSDEEMEKEKMRTMLTKPEIFRVEDEWRMLFSRERDGKPWDPVLTINSPRHVRRNLRKAIVDEGNASPSFS